MPPTLRPGAFAAALTILAAAMTACDKKPAATNSPPVPPPIKTTAVVPPEVQPVKEPEPAPSTTPEAQAPAPPAITPPAVTPPAAPTTPPTPPPTETLKTWETPTGLIIEELRIGTGTECPPGARVVMHYRGTLADQREFDSSYNRGQPLDVSLNNLIKGWQEGVPGMKVGGKRRLIVPPALGYGKRGSPPAVPPDALLIFEIELLDVVQQ